MIHSNRKPKPLELLGFAMKRMLLSETAVFIELNAVGGVLFVFHGIVVTLLALGAGQHDLIAGNACHVSHLLLEMGRLARPNGGQG